MSVRWIAMESPIAGRRVGHNAKHYQDGRRGFLRLQLLPQIAVSEPSALSRLDEQI